MEHDAAALAAKIKASPKYAGIAQETVLRVCEEYLPRYKSEKDAVKAVKRRLHTIHGAFFPEGSQKRAMALIEDGSLDGRELSLKLMALHPSTRERLPFIGRFYAVLAPYLKEARSVWDIGCGFHPCALPFMGLPEGVLYRAGDIDQETVAVADAFLTRLSVRHEARMLDATLTVPTEKADAAFLFKLLPLLMQRDRGAVPKLLASLPADILVVTFPVRSLSGRDKNMEAFYGEQFESGLPVGLSILKKETVGTELVYVVSRGA